MAPPTLRALGIGETLDVAIKIYLRNAWTLFRLVLLVVAPGQLVSVLVTASATPGDGFTFDDQTGEFHVDDSFGPAFAGGVVVGILAILSSVLASGVLFKAIVDAYLGSPVSWRGALGYVARRFHSMLWIVFLAALVSILGAL